VSSLVRGTVGSVRDTVSGGLDKVGNVVSGGLDKAKEAKEGFWHTRSNTHAAESEMFVTKYLESEAKDTAQEGTKSGGCLLSPLGPHRMAWDVCGMLLILYLSLTIPMDMSFSSGATYNEYDFFSFAFFIDLFFIFDILLNFNTCYYYKGVLVTSRCKIAKTYLKGFFLLDLAASIPYDMIIALVNEDGQHPAYDSTKVLRSSKMLRMMRMVRALKIIRLVRIFRLRVILYKLEEAVQSQAVVLMMNMIKYLGIMIYLAHWEACGWHGIAKYWAHGYPCNWLQSLEDGEPGFGSRAWDKYIASLYWAITTMSTVGYGDIVPCNQTERVFAISAMVIACGMFAMIIGSMQNVLGKFGEERSEFDRTLVRTMRYLKSQKVSQHLQFKVKSYLEHNFENRSSTGMDKAVLSNLSSALRSEVKLALLLPIVERYPLFRMSSRPMLVRVCSNCATARHAPGDVIYDEGTVASSMVFVVNGKLVLMREDRGRARGARDGAAADADEREAGRNADEGIEELSEGAWLGAVNLFVTEIREYSLIAVTFIELLEITQAAFKTILEDFPAMQERYREYQQRVMAGDRACVEFPEEAAVSPARNSWVGVPGVVGDFARSGVDIARSGVDIARSGADFARSVSPLKKQDTSDGTSPKPAEP
jgi:CRP-like cAMP-binding protein